jgi:branched-chain amino acid transport system substrate-binding protein
MLGPAGCDSAPAGPTDPIPVGLLLSFSGYNAANSINSERALTMALEVVNASGGIEGRPLQVMARDTRSQGGTGVSEPARALFKAGAAILIGPDTIDLTTQLRPALKGDEHTILLPSFGTASDVGFGNKPKDWFVMGPGTGRVACELVAQLAADGRQSALVVYNARGYNSNLSFNLGNRFGMPKFVLPAEGSSTMATVKGIVASDAEAYILAAFPADASSLIYALAADGSLGDPARWYLSPTLHNPAFLATIPKGALAGAHGVSAGTVAGAMDFRNRFAARWHDTPLDDAYPFYDAGAVAALAIERALIRQGAIPCGTGLTEHVLAVTHAGGRPIQWDELELGLALVRKGQDIEYVGLTGRLEFDASGQAPYASTKWWQIHDKGFDDIAQVSDCR